MNKKYTFASSDLQISLMDLSSAVIFVAGHGPLDCACNTLLISLIARWNLQQEADGKM